MNYDDNRKIIRNFENLKIIDIALQRKEADVDYNIEMNDENEKYEKINRKKVELHEKLSKELERYNQMKYYEDREPLFKYKNCDIKFNP